MLRLLVAIGVVICLGGCISQTQYEQAKAQRDQAQAEAERLKASIPELERKAAAIAKIREQLAADRETLNEFIQMSTTEMTNARSFLLRFFGEVVKVASDYAVLIDNTLTDFDEIQSQLAVTLTRSQASLASSQERLKEANEAIDRIEEQRTSLFNSVLGLVAPAASAVPGGGVAVGLLGTLAGAGGLSMFGIKARESNRRKKIIETTEQFGLITNDPAMEESKNRARELLGEAGRKELNKIVKTVARKITPGNRER
ncbi:MAG: hypothetical protein AAGB48_06150 [Planctomycetota bacterium]